MKNSNKVVVLTLLLFLLFYSNSNCFNNKYDN